MDTLLDFRAEKQLDECQDARLQKLRDEFSRCIVPSICEFHLIYRHLLPGLIYCGVVNVDDLQMIFNTVSSFIPNSYCVLEQQDPYHVSIVAFYGGKNLIHIDAQFNDPNGVDFHLRDMCEHLKYTYHGGFSLWSRQRVPLQLLTNRNCLKLRNCHVLAFMLLIIFNREYNKTRRFEPIMWIENFYSSGRVLETIREYIIVTEFEYSKMKKVRKESKNVYFE